MNFLGKIVYGVVLQGPGDLTHQNEFQGSHPKVGERVPLNEAEDFQSARRKKVSGEADSTHKERRPRKLICPEKWMHGVLEVLEAIP